MHLIYSGPKHQEIKINITLIVIGLCYKIE